MIALWIYLLLGACFALYTLHRLHVTAQSDPGPDVVLQALQRDAEAILATLRASHAQALLAAVALTLAGVPVAAQAIARALAHVYRMRRLKRRVLRAVSVIEGRR